MKIMVTSTQAYKAFRFAARALDDAQSDLSVSRASLHEVQDAYNTVVSLMPVRVTRMKLSSQGYSERGQYFGVGLPLWHLTDDAGCINRFVRAATRALAIEQIPAGRKAARPVKTAAKAPTQLRIGYKVKAHLPRGGHVEGRIVKVERTGDFVRAYGVQVTLDCGYTVGRRDIFEISK
jgi:hypothetical protein